jgi:tripartite-type tricarboxylate transporter receptor subunit TctC
MRAHGPIVMSGRIFTAVALMVMVASVCDETAAQSYPSRPVRMVAPYTPGSPNDVMARLLAQQLQSRLSQPFVVENKPGGATTIGSKAVAMAAPDGYTLLYSSSSLIIEPTLRRRSDYDPQKDFAPIAFVARSALMLTVGTHVPASSPGELIVHAKANPRMLSLGFAQGTASQLIGELFNRKYGLEIISVPYKGGALAIPDLLGGRIHVYWPTPATVLPLIREGKLRALAISSPERHSDLPDVPTMDELNFGELAFETWSGLWGPAGLPGEIAERLNAATAESLRSSEMTESMRKLGFQTRVESVTAFKAFITNEIVRWERVVKGSGFALE